MAQESKDNRSTDVQPKGLDLTASVDDDIEAVKLGILTPNTTGLQRLYNVSWSVVCGDIFSQNTDVIVVSNFGSCLGTTALQRAGHRTRSEFHIKIQNRLRRADKYVVTTRGGNLKCKHIVHIEEFDQDYYAGKWSCFLTQGIIESLQSCEKLAGCVSVTIPLLYSHEWKTMESTEISRTVACADITVFAALDYFEQMSGRSNIKEVVFIDKKMQKAESLEEALEKGLIEGKALPYGTPTQMICEYTYRSTGTRLILATGDPKKQPADVLVNPSDDFWASYSGLTANILLEAVLPTDVIKEAYASSTKLEVTAAGKLPFQHLYHVRGNQRDVKDHTQQYLQIEACTYQCLMTAEHAGVHSLVLPMIYNRYTTIGQYLCTVVMLNTIHMFLAEHKRQRSLSIKEVYFYTRYPSNAFALKYELISRYKDEVADITGQVPLEVLARGHEANIAFIEAIEEGSKSIYQTRLMLVGPERVGKTSLTKALTGQDFDSQEGITDGIETSMSCTLSVKHTTNWKPKQTEGRISEARQQYLRAVAEEITAKLLQTKQEQQSQYQDIHPSKNGEPENTGNGETHEYTKPGNASSDAVEPSDDRTSSHDPPASVDVDSLMMVHSQHDSRTPEEVIQLVLEMLQANDKRIDNGGLVETADDLILSIWDFAGQDLYYITHQVFLVSRAIYIICFNLCHDLNKPARVQIFKREGGQITVTEHHMTNLDFIIFWLRSIYSNTAENQSMSHQRQLSPAVFIAGTHRESLPGNAQEKQALAEEKLAAIKNALKGTPYEGHVVTKYYAIDNSLRSPLDQAIVELRDHITKVARLEHYMGERIPIKWLDFLHEIEQLRKQQKHSINFKEVRALAAKCGVSKEMQLFTLLHFYHDLGDIVYYGERDTPDSALNDIIVLNPHWLIFVFSRVITVKNPSEQWAKFARSWARLDEEGLLEEKLIRHMWNDLLDQLEGLLQLMQKFDLLCVKTAAEDGDRLFYAPSLLKKQSEEMVCIDDLVKSQSATVLYIDFNGFLPEGLFHRLLVQLVQWSQSMGGEPRLFYQQANLYVDEDHDMIIRILPKNRSCIQVMQLLGEKLGYLGHTWMKRIDFDFCVLCTVCDKAKTHFHKLQKCLAKKRVPCGLQRMDTTQLQRLFGDFKAKSEVSRDTVISLKLNMPPFLESLRGVFDEIASPILPFHIMTEICVLLDPVHPLSNDWRGLACKLGYDHYINYLATKDSPTMCVMNGWCQKGLSVDDLKESLSNMNRHDVVRLVDKHLSSKE